LGEKEMKVEKSYAFKWRKDPDIIIVAVVFSFLVIIPITTNFSKIHNKDQLWLLILIIAIIVIDIALFICNFVFSWTTVIYFDNEKAWQKIKRQTYEWRWEDITECKTIRGILRYAVSLQIKTKPGYKKLTFDFNEYRYKKLMKFCPHEYFKTLLKKAWDY
jgi:hypothetical protein